MCGSAPRRAVRVPRCRTAVAGGIATVVLGMASPTPAGGGATQRASLSSSGQQGSGNSLFPSISADGRHVVFSSAAALVPEDTNGIADIYVRDRATEVTSRVSVSSTGVESNGFSDAPWISGDGRFVAFSSFASNLVHGDTNRVGDIFVHDRETGATERVSISSNGTEADNHNYFPVISVQGQVVAWQSDASNLIEGDTNGRADVYAHDLHTGKTTLISATPSGSPGNFSSYKPSISADGRRIAFVSEATDLVPEDTFSIPQIFVHDRVRGETTIVSTAASGDVGNGLSFSASLSADGGFVAFETWATNFVPGDTNGANDVMVKNLTTGDIVRASVSSNGKQGLAHSVLPSLSSHGRFVAFTSYAPDLVPADTNFMSDIFVRDVEASSTTRVSISTYGEEGDGHSDMSAISADGRFVAFHSWASNLAPGDTNLSLDAFVHDRVPGPPTCPPHEAEKGPLSGRTHGRVEPIAGPGAPIVHEVSCGWLAPAGL